MPNVARKEYPFLKASTPKSDGLKQYYSELADLGTDGLYMILDHGREWAEQVASNLAAGGGAIFPHTYISKCGYQIAAVIIAIMALHMALQKMLRYPWMNKD
jgi:hypothetical protein